ncbi:hypothetical protein [Roseomonas marmotae]|uniref:Uncharacterized protein n=1 Tax=Roseomonas marmotae TaxID=2768161 RepID=A0ABS3KGB9_9PROT|nr:hypothetical protein [Roseomonas marmotae]MBO1076516.1 hypothetical protein [Roseomonas marmotae]QTI81866.1 hypothetical protein IAI58_21205 [Roseomonas marmotae]
MLKAEGSRRWNWPRLPERMPPANEDAMPPYVDEERWYIGEMRAGRLMRLHPYGMSAHHVTVDDRKLIFPSKEAYLDWLMAEGCQKPAERGLLSWLDQLWARVTQRV